MTQPEFVYHYTNAQGFKGIIENKVIWATDVWYMNDTREATFGLDVAEEFLRSKQDDTGNRQNKRAKLCLEMLQSFRKQQDELPASFIACFSKNDDQLSQWRAYAADGGFSIGFDKGMLENSLTQMPGANQPTMREVIYGREHQFLALDSHYARTAGDIGIDATNFTAWTFMLAPAIKNAAFSEESEVRLHLFYDAEKDAGSSLKFRASAMGLTPYIEVNLWENDEESPIREIIIGPTAHPVQTERAIKQFLRRNGLKHALLRHSDVPLRS